jgi:hypothetical protein
MEALRDMVIFKLFLSRVILGLAVSLAVPELLYAAKPKSAEVGLSLLSYQMMTMTKSPSGKKETMGTSFYHLALQYHQPVGQYLWSPWLRYMPDSISAVKSPNGSSKTSIFAIGTPFTYNLSPVADVATGPVVMRYTIYGFGGGKETLNNGESTAEFYQPTESKSALSLAWQLGTSYSVADFRAAADLLVHGLFSSKKRSFSLMITGTWVKPL